MHFFYAQESSGVVWLKVLHFINRLILQYPSYRQIRGVIDINIFLNSSRKRMLWYSLEAPRRGASNEYPNISFRGEIRKYQYFSDEKKSPPYLELWSIGSKDVCEYVYWIGSSSICGHREWRHFLLILASVLERMIVTLTLVMLNKLICPAHSEFSDNQITWSRLLIYIHILKGKQCRSRSVGFFRRQGISGFSMTRVYNVLQYRHWYHFYSSLRQCLFHCGRQIEFLVINTAFSFTVWKLIIS